MTLHWSTNLVPKMEQGSRTSSHTTDFVKISPESTKIQVQIRSYLGESAIFDWHPITIYSVLGGEAWHWTQTVLDSECSVVGDVGVWFAIVVEIVTWVPS